MKSAETLQRALLMRSGKGNSLSAPRSEPRDGHSSFRAGSSCIRK